MKYEKEIDALFKELFYEDWMSLDDYEELIESFIKVSGITKQQLSDDLETGVKNGYPVEQQIEFLKVTFDRI